MKTLLERGAAMAALSQDRAVGRLQQQLADLMPDAQIEAAGDRVVIIARRLGRRFLEQPVLRFLWSNER